MSYDNKFDCFLLGTPHEVSLVKDTNDIVFREVKKPAAPGAPTNKELEHMKVNLREIISSQYDLVGNFKHSGPINLVEFSNEYGVLIFSIGKELVLMQANQVFQTMVNGKVGEIKKIAFESVVKYIKICKNQLIINVGQKLHFYDLDGFIFSKGAFSPNISLEIKFNGFIRQIANSPKNLQNILVTTSDQNLFEIVDYQISGPAKFKARSAIYNKSGDFVLVLQNQQKEDQGHIQVFKSGDLNNQLNEIRLSFPAEVKRNYFKTYYMTEYGDQNHLFIYSAFFESDEDKEENLGLPLVFIIDSDITGSSGFDSLKPKIQYHFHTELAHNSDEDDGSQPIIKSVWLSNKLCLVHVNHLTQPHILRLKNGKFEALEYTNIRAYPNIPRPKDDRGNQLDAQECLGSTLGCFMVQSILTPEMDKKVKVKLFEEEQDFSYPAILGVYGLDGNLYTYFIYHQEFQSQSCHKRVKDVGVVQRREVPIPKQEEAKIPPKEEAKAPFQMPKQEAKAPDFSFPPDQEEAKGPAGFSFPPKQEESKAPAGFPPKQEESKAPQGFSFPPKQEESKGPAAGFSFPPKKDPPKAPQPQADPQDMPQPQDNHKIFNQLLKNIQPDVDRCDFPEDKVQDTSKMVSLQKKLLAMNEEPQIKLPQNIPQLPSHEQLFKMFLQTKRMDYASYQNCPDGLKKQITQEFFTYKKQKAKEIEILLETQIEKLQWQVDFNKKLKEKSNKIEEQKRQIVKEVPPLNIFVLNLEKQLTEKYNSTAIAQIKDFQAQLARDFQILPQFYEIEELSHNQGEIIAQQLKDIGQATLMKNQLIQSKDFIKKQIAMGYQIPGDPSVDQPGDIFDHLEFLLKKNGLKVDTLNKCKTYIKQYDQLSHFVKTFKQIEMVLKDQMRGHVSQSDLVKIKQQIERQKNNLNPPKQQFGFKKLEKRNENEIAKIYADINLRIQTRFMEEIILNIDQRLDEIRSSYVGKKSGFKISIALDDDEIEEQINSKLEEPKLDVQAKKKALLLKLRNFKVKNEIIEFKPKQQEVVPQKTLVEKWDVEFQKQIESFDFKKQEQQRSQLLRNIVQPVNIQSIPLVTHQEESKNMDSIVKNFMTQRSGVDRSGVDPVDEKRLSDSLLKDDQTFAKFSQKLKFDSQQNDYSDDEDDEEDDDVKGLTDAPDLMPRLSKTQSMVMPSLSKPPEAKIMPKAPLFSAPKAAPPPAPVQKPSPAPSTPPQKKSPEKKTEPPKPAFGGMGFGLKAPASGFGAPSAADIAASQKEKPDQPPAKIFGQGFGGAGTTFGAASAGPTFGAASAGPTFGSIGGFGQGQKPATTTQSNPTTFGGFGQTQQSTGLGGSKPLGQQPTGGFGAGQPQQSSGFGQKPTQPSGFGQNPTGGFGQNPTGGFGQNPSQPAGFGQTNPQPSTGFGNPGGAFGSQPFSGGGFSGGQGGGFFSGGNMMNNQSKLAQNTEKDPFASGSQAPSGFATQMNFGGGQQQFGAKPPVSFGKPRK